MKENQINEEVAQIGTDEKCIQSIAGKHDPLGTSIINWGIVLKWTLQAELRA